MKKAECTPEQWDAYRAYQREWARAHPDKIRARNAAKLARETPEQRTARLESYKRRARKPEVIARKKAYDATPEARARRRAHAQTQEAKIRAKNRMEERLRTIPGLRDYRNNWHRLYNTGFSAELVEQLANFQHHACAICRRPFSETNKHHADHCHESEEPRGLLCFQCNIIEGKLKAIGLTALELGQRLHDYLLNPPARLLKTKG